MSVEACRALVERGDPDRALVTRGASAAAQALLWPLWAFNLEVARAPWASREPAVAEIRLQFWAEGISRPAGHPVLEALGGRGGPELAALVEARRRDVWRERFDGPEALGAYLEATSSGLLWAAATALGAGPGAERAVRDFGRGAGMAAWLRALPELRARGWEPMWPGAEVAGLARDGLARIAAARAARETVPASAFPALATGWLAEGVLQRAAAEPEAVAEGRLAPSEFARRAGLVRAGLTGRW